jgi:hypothetical protein
MQMIHRIQDDERFLDSVIFSDESTFHVSGNCRISGRKNPRVFLKHVHGSQKVSLFCALSKERVYGSFFFMETTITGIMYLDMLQHFLNPQLEEDDQEGRIHFQQDFAPLLYLGEVCESISAPVSQVGGLVERHR